MSLHRTSEYLWQSLILEFIFQVVLQTGKAYIICEITTISGILKFLFIHGIRFQTNHFQNHVKQSNCVAGYPSFNEAVGFSNPTRRKTGVTAKKIQKYTKGSIRHPYIGRKDLESSKHTFVNRVVNN